MNRPSAPVMKAPKLKSRSQSPTTTLAIAGLGAKEEDIERARAAGMVIPTHAKRLHLLLYGPPGTAKTVNAHILPRTRTLDLDDGMQSVEWAIRAGIIKKDPSEIVYKTILPTLEKSGIDFVIDQCSDAIDEWIEEEDIPPEEWDRPYPQFWDTLIIDSGSALTDGTIPKALKENDRLGISKSWEKYTGRVSVTPMMIQDWGSASSLFQKFINQCRALGKNIVLICHEYHTEDDNGTLLSIDPLLIGQLRNKLPKDFDECWYAHVRGTREKPEYLFQINPDPKKHLRSRTGCLAPVEPANFNAIRAKIAKFYGVPEDRIWTAYHGSEGRERAEQEIIRTSSTI